MQLWASVAIWAKIVTIDEAKVAGAAHDDEQSILDAVPLPDCLAMAICEAGPVGVGFS
jgi:hypothetical protein